MKEPEAFVVPATKLVESADCALVDVLKPDAFYLAAGSREAGCVVTPGGAAKILLHRRHIVLMLQCMDQLDAEAKAAGEAA